MAVLARINYASGRWHDIKFITLGRIESWVNSRLKSPDIVNIVLTDEETGEVVTVGKEEETSDKACGYISQLLEFLMRNPHPEQEKIQDVLVGLTEVLSELQSKKLLAGLGQRALKELE